MDPPGYGDDKNSDSELADELEGTGGGDHLLEGRSGKTLHGEGASTTVLGHDERCSSESAITSVVSRRTRIVGCHSVILKLSMSCNTRHG